MMSSEVDAGPPLNEPDKVLELESLPLATKASVSPAGNESPSVPLHPKRKLSLDPKDLLDPKRHRGTDNPQINTTPLTTDTENDETPSSPQAAIEAPIEIQGCTQNGMKDGGGDKERLEVSSSDAFKEELNSILGDNGGLKLTQHVPRLDLLLSKEQGLKHRWTLLTVVELSSKECQKCLVQGNGLKTLERWLVEAREANKPQFLTKVIECISVLPVDLGILKNCTMGKTMGLLRRHDFLAVRQAAKGLVDKWKGLVIKPGSDRPKLKDPPILEKGNPVAQGEKISGKAVKPMKSGLKAENLGKLVAVDDSQMFNPTPPPRRPRKVVNRQKSPAGQNPPQKQTTSSVVRAMVSGVGTFGGDNKDALSMSLISAQGKVDLTYMQDFTKPSPLTTVPIECERSALKNGTEILGPNNYPLESVQNTSISEDIKDSNSLKDGCSADVHRQLPGGTNLSLEETESTSKEQIDAKNLDPTNPEASSNLQCPQLLQQIRNPPNDQPPTLDSADFGGEGRLPSCAHGVKMSWSQSNLPSAPATVIGRSGLLRFGGLSNDEMTGSDNRVGSISAPFIRQRTPSCAWETTNSKAPFIPIRASSLEKEVRRSSKRKRVTWASEDQLINTRWFKKEDPPDCVNKDAFYTPEEFAAQEYLEVRHSPFSSAARLEHLNESEAIRESKRKEFQQECAQPMIRQCPWEQPVTVSLNPDWKVSFGEGSKEKLTQTRREEGVVAMRNTKNTIIPSNPMEPEPEPPHKGHTNIIPYNTPKAEENQASGGQQIPVQEQAATPQPINEGFSVTFQQPQSSVPALQQGFVAQNTFMPQQVIQQPSGQPQTVLVLQSSTARPPVLMPVGTSQPMLMAQRTNQTVLAAGPHQQVLISGHPQSVQVQPSAVHYQMAPGSFIATRPQGMVQHLVIAGQDPNISVQQNQFGQQVYAVPGSVLQTNVRPQAALASRVMPQEHQLSKSANSVPGWRP